MPTPRSIQRTYLVLMLGNTLAASFIWGINTIFLLDARTRGPVHRWGGLLRLLRAPALPLGALRRPQAYQVAGLVAAIVAASQILGGIAAPLIHRLFRRRTSGLFATALLGVISLGLIGTVESFWAVIALIAVWGLAFAASMPIRQAYISGMIPSRQRATILSFDSLMTSVGGVWASTGTRPLGRRLGIRALVSDERRHHGRGAPVSGPVSKGERSRRRR